MMDQRREVLIFPGGHRRQKMKTLHRQLPTQKSNEACRRLGLTLPPIQAKSHHITSKTSREKIVKKTCPQPRPTVIFGQSLADYVTKPSYFCHPVVVPSMAPPSGGECDASKTRKLPPSCNQEKQVDAKSDKQPPKRRDSGTIEPLTLKPSLRSPTRRSSHAQKKEKQHSAKFLEFCKREGFDASSSDFAKISNSFNQNSRKFGPVAKPSRLCALTEGECVVIAERPIVTSATMPQRNETMARPRRRSSAAKSIRENAQKSAERGKQAAERAHTFILRDLRDGKSVLPPIKTASPAKAEGFVSQTER